MFLLQPRLPEFHSSVSSLFAKGCCVPPSAYIHEPSYECEAEITDTGESSNRSTVSSESDAPVEPAAMPSQTQQRRPNVTIAAADDSDSLATQARTKSTLPKLERANRRVRTELRAAMHRLPHPRAFQRSKPLYSQILDKTIGEIREDFTKDDECVIKRFLRDVMGCFDTSESDWAQNEKTHSDMVKSFEYKTLLPNDVPNAVVRLCRLPQTILGSTLVRVCSNDVEFAIIQHSRTHNVLYGERFLMQNTISFQQHHSGGVLLQQWTEVVWIEPLPWTHGVVKYFIEAKAESGARGKAAEFARVIKDSSAMPLLSSEGIDTNCKLHDRQEIPHMRDCADASHKALSVQQVSTESRRSIPVKTNQARALNSCFAFLCNWKIPVFFDRHAFGASAHLIW